MQADPAMTDEYVPPGLVYKFCLFVAFVGGVALIFPVHMLTAKKAAAGDVTKASVAVTYPEGRAAKSFGPVHLASATPSLDSTPFGNPFQATPLPTDPMPFEAMPLEPMPIEPAPDQAVSFEPSPYELTPSAEGSNGALRQPPTIDEELVFQPAPVEAAPSEDPVPAPPVQASEAVEPMPTVAVQPAESASDTSAAPMPAIVDAMPAPVVEAAPAPVVDVMPVDVAPIRPDRPITCTSPVPEPVVLRANSANPPQLPQAYPSPVHLGPMKQSPTTTQPKQAAQPRPQVYRPKAPEPQPQQRQSFNHPGYGTSNFPTYAR